MSKTTNSGNATNTANSVTLNPSSDTIARMVDFYSEQKQANNNPYIVLFAKTDDCAISIYTTNKVLFQGDAANAEAAIWQSIDAQSPIPKATTIHSPSINNNISINQFVAHGGSDEVGTGDYFGPVCVCACVVTKESYEEIQHLGVDDSKAMDDTKIVTIAPLLKEILPYSLLILSNKKYNEIHSQYNMNGIKAMLHNQAYVHLRNKIGKLPDLCVVDQFAPPASYFRHLRHERDVVRTLHFETKAESKYLAVACASVIARHAFLAAMDQLGDAYDMILPKGAGANVDKVAKAFLDHHGMAALGNIAKLHFANTKKITEHQERLF